MRPGRFGAVLVVACAVLVTLSTGGCVTQRSATAGDVVCRHEALTGSHIVERRCYRRRDMVEREARDRAFVDRLIIQANRPHRNPGTGTPNPR